MTDFIFCKMANIVQAIYQFKMLVNDCFILHILLLFNCLSATFIYFLKCVFFEALANKWRTEPCSRSPAERPFIDWVSDRWFLNNVFGSEIVLIYLKRLL